MSSRPYAADDFNAINARLQELEKAKLREFGASEAKENMDRDQLIAFCNTLKVGDVITYTAKNKSNTYSYLNTTTLDEESLTTLKNYVATGHIIRVELVKQ